jgi:hypothetical protein
VSDVRWERSEPVEPCLSPDGHTYVDLMDFTSYVPRGCICPRCGQQWQIVVLPRDTP